MDTPPAQAIQFIPATSKVISAQKFYALEGSTPHQWLDTDSITTKLFITPEGPLTMIRSDATAKDNFWRAGTLVLERARASYPFTGRIIEHLDKLTIGAKEYPDVLQVHYSHEGATDTIPSWTVFYQKNRGPIMVTRTKTVNGQTTTTSKHVTN
jgi:hypothetical protein